MKTLACVCQKYVGCRSIHVKKVLRLYLSFLLLGSRRQKTGRGDVVIPFFADVDNSLGSKPDLQLIIRSTPGWV